MTRFAAPFFSKVGLWSSAARADGVFHTTKDLGSFEHDSAVCMSLEGFAQLHIATKASSG